MLIQLSKRSNSNLRTYVQVKLLDSMVKSKRYYFEYFVNLPEGIMFACNNVAAILSKNAVYVDTINYQYGVLYSNGFIMAFANPVITDTINWVKISGIYNARGGEQFLTLGNFQEDTGTLIKQVQSTGYYGAAYFLDDVSIIPLDSMCLKADAGKDTTITIGDSIFIGSYTNGLDSVKWLQGTTVIDSTRPGFWVKPTTGTSYILQQTINGCFSADTVTIGVLVPLKFVSFILRQAQDDSVGLPTPSPSKEGNVLLQWQTANEINVSHFNIQRSVNGVAFTAIGKTVAQNKSSNSYEFTDVHLPSLEGLGVGLFYRIQAIDKDGKISYSEIRNISYSHVNHSISVYPNPAKDNVTINCVGMKEIQIVNSLGQVIKQIKVNTNTQKIDISGMLKGLFLLKIITTENKIYNEKLIIQ